MPYTFQGKEFTLKKNVLDLYKNIAPLLKRRNELIFEFTKDIDLRPYNEQVSRINRVKAELEGTVKEDVKKKLTERLEKLQSDLDNDSKIQSALNFRNDQIEAAMFELATDKGLLKVVIPQMLEGETEIFNFDEATMELVELIFQVLKDFFLLIPKSRNA